MTDRITFDAPVEHVFADTEGRRIAGLAVPAGAVAKTGGRSFRFLADSIEFGDRTPLLAYHDSTRPVGRLTGSRWTDRGLEVEFSVSKIQAGDEILALASDGVLGLSVGVDIPADGARLSGDVLEVRAAIGREISVTPTPAYAGSVIDSVAMSGDGFHDERTVNVTDAPTEAVAPVTVSLDHEALAQAFAAAMPTPQPVPVASVREEAPYRFDGGRGRFEFSTDLIAMSKGDGEAGKRIEGFLSAAFDTDRADVSALNPTRGRPDLYVDQREFKYPLWSAVNKGTLADSTPFVFPRFNSSSNLVSNHTEGVEPSPGTFTASSSTVTPQAVSGRVEITREAWDQGGNPQLSGLIWRQMVRAYYEALEAYVVATLDAASPAQIMLTAGAADNDLQAEIVQAFTALQFIRGGFRFDNFATQIDLYKALVSAVDGSSRPLFPVINPTNANGTAQPFFASLNVAGVRAIPAWSLAATGTTAASSYLFDSESVHAWATAPQRLEFQYRVAYVDLAIWGYKACAISDLAGVREVVYDPEV